MKEAIYFCERRQDVARVYAGAAGEKLKTLYALSDRVYSHGDLGKSDFSKVEAIFSTWGMPQLTREEIRTYFPSLKGVFYAAGSVQAFAREFLEEGVRVFSAWRANAVPVAEYAVAQIVLANKGFYRLARMSRENYERAAEEAKNYKGNYRAKVGVLGDGAIGSEVIKRLKEYAFEIYVYSITMSEGDAIKAGVKKASLQQIFEECDVITNHLANNAATQGILGGELLRSMKPYSTFINTGRGAQVDEEALIKKLSSDPTVTAVLDVTFPEPPQKNSPLYTLPNAVLTPHVAGSMGQEVVRMAQYMADESERFFDGELCPYEVTEQMLERMA